MGWEYVTDRSTLWHIFRCRDAAAPELETDPVVQGYLFDRVYRRQRWQLVLGFVLELLLAVWLAWFVASSPAPVELLLEKLPALVLLAVMLVMCTVELTAQLCFCRRLRRRLAAGIPAGHTGNWRRARLHAVLFWSMDLLLILTLLYPFAPKLTNISVELSEAAEPLPYVAATELDPTLNTAERVIGEAYREQELLVPVRYDIWEIYEGQRRIETKLDRLRFSAFVGPLYRERYSAMLELWPKTDVIPIADERFDEAVLIKGGAKVSMLLVRQEKMVFSVWTNFPVDLMAYLDDFAAILAKDW